MTLAPGDAVASSGRMKTGLEWPVRLHMKIMLCTHAHSPEPDSYWPIEAPAFLASMSLMG